MRSIKAVLVLSVLLLTGCAGSFDPEEAAMYMRAFDQATKPLVNGQPRTTYCNKYYGQVTCTTY